ncbi:hypothetical protein A9Q84_13470 [Halobacteriovorax marinus]|uniref:Secreted protein n=1 Tax=Halobacteriovorax marinus TaxID=97084 RepID=A0A1Y5F8V7_9BACT|nr:hypothetical protein A9Q84_13470 [Halobacteriovorax marinus]
MKTLLSLITLIGLSSNVYAATGLAGGDVYLNHRIEGNITITCSNGSERDTAYVTCRSSYLSPSSRSKFVYDSGVDADKVEISYTNSRGKIKTKSSKLRSTTSKKSFNLWIRSLTQRPLLKAGNNALAYKLTKKGNVVERGLFDVRVDRQPVRYCSYRSFYSSSMSDCRSASLVCDRYFRQQNDCQ